MKFIKFDVNSSLGRTSAKPSIRFHVSGIICISRMFVDAAKLKIGDKVSIVQDEDQPDDWYLMSNDPNGFTLREYKGNNGLCFNCSHISKSIIEFLEVETRSVGFKISTEPSDCDPDNLPSSESKLFSIITASASYNELETEVEVEEQ